MDYGIAMITSETGMTSKATTAMNGGNNMIPKTTYTVHGETVTILSGYSCTETIDRSGKTISGNVTHVARIRNKAIAILNK